MEVTALAQGDDLLGQSAHLLCLRLGGNDLLVTEEIRHLVAEERKTVVCGPAQLAPVNPVRQATLLPPRRRSRPSAPSACASTRESPLLLRRRRERASRP